MGRRRQQLPVPDLEHRVRQAKLKATMRGGEFEALDKSLKDYEEKSKRLEELNSWCGRASRELEGAAKDDPRWATLERVRGSAESLEKEIEQIEEIQEASLTAIVEQRGPIVCEVEDGTHKTLAATPGSRGDGDTLIPRDLLAVWRVARVFEGSVVMGGKPTRLSFGDPAQAATVRLSPKKPKKDAVVSEEGHLFGKD